VLFYQVDAELIQRYSAAASSLFSHIKVGILQAINHVLVYCCGVNAFYTPFVAEFNLITNHIDVYLS